MNRFFLIILFSSVFMMSASAQFSVQTQYHNSLQDNANTTSPHSVLDASIHYWTRLKKYRVELLPGLIFQSLQSNQENFQNIGVTIPISFYALDFANDCDCPTFSKNAFWFQKGFFLRLTPSWSKNTRPSKMEGYNHLLGAGISTGLDFGVSDILTITPLIGYDQVYSLSGNSDNSQYLHIGLSFLFRHDYRKRFR